MWCVRGLYVLAVLAVGMVMIVDGGVAIACVAFLGLLLMESAGTLRAGGDGR